MSHSSLLPRRCFQRIIPAGHFYPHHEKENPARLIVAREESSPKVVLSVNKVLVSLLCGIDRDMDNARGVGVVVVQGVADVFLILLRLYVAAVLIASLPIGFNSAMMMSKPDALVRS